MSDIVPHIFGVSDAEFFQLYQLHLTSTLWLPEVWADGSIFRQLAEELQLDALPHATPVQDNTMSNEDITPPDDATATPATPTSNNDYGPSYIFNEFGYRIDHGFASNTMLAYFEPQTGLKLLKDHDCVSTGTKLFVLVDVRAKNKWRYTWAVTFSAQNPFNALNREGVFQSSAGQRTEACVHAFREAINSIIDFVNMDHNAKPPISNFYVRVPQSYGSTHALNKSFREVEQGVILGDDAPEWRKKTYGALAKTLVRMRKLRAQGFNVMLWQRR
ncbi:hypothetical protein DER46DRAFT_687615 [Fusarium sp. MPI-SDFR-AT-0072]|nr:hypothetical protein DER46DRAFT_687615 [Fusarium sp. MPI-SDFR-AT-0072]